MNFRRIEIEAFLTITYNVNNAVQISTTLLASFVTANKDQTTNPDLIVILAY